MRAVAQRVSSARVEVNSDVVGEIGHGLLVYVGCGQDDSDEQVRWMANKLAGLRIFTDQAGKMSQDVQQVEGAILLVSQFTLYGDVRKGRRPSFDKAGNPETARALYEKLATALTELGLPVQTGRFQAMMDVHACVAGPVTILIDSDKGF